MRRGRTAARPPQARRADRARQRPGAALGHHLPPPVALYGALIASLVLTWVVPQESLLGLPTVARFLAGGSLAFAPVFLANLIFSQRFKDVATSGDAFAANLLGAMAGGTLEYLALITGYRFLLIVVGALYALAFIAGKTWLSRPLRA